MKLGLSLAAAIATMTVFGAASATPLTSAAIQAGRTADGGAPVVDVRFRHRDMGNRGRHLGWYKLNRGRHLGWRHSRHRR